MNISKQTKEVREKLEDILEKFYYDEQQDMMDSVDEILALFNSEMEKKEREIRKEVENVLFTEGGFLREDTNLASDILSTLEKGDK